MRIDPSADRAMRETLGKPLREFRRPWLALLTALMTLAEDQAELVHHAERPWASVTFSGTRHSVTLVFTGDVAVAAGERFIVALSDHEFAIPRQLVADAAVIEIEQTALPAPKMRVTCELLLLEDG